MTVGGENEFFKRIYLSYESYLSAKKQLRGKSTLPVVSLLDSNGALNLAFLMAKDKNA